MTLSVLAVTNAKPREKPYKLFDDHGLFLLVQPSGGKLWRYKYRVNGRDEAGKPKRIEKKLSLGSFPTVTLKEARERCAEARKLVEAGGDPAEKKRRDADQARLAATNTFEEVAKAYIKKNERDGLAPATIRKRRWHLSLLLRTLGPRPISEIEPFEVLESVRPFEAAKNDEKAHKTLEFIGQVFRYAVASQLARGDVTRDLRGALAKRQPKPMAAIIDAEALGGLLRAIDGYEGYPTTKLALQLTPHLFQRPGELRQAEWSEIDLDAAVWLIPATKMKRRREHAVPLSRQSIAMLEELRALTGHRRYVFPSLHGGDRCMSENTVNAALRRMGYSSDDMTAHGFRSTASSLLNESGEWSADAIEKALAHGDRDRIRGIYHRGQHWDERVAMAQWWSDYLDGLRGA